MWLWKDIKTWKSQTFKRRDKRWHRYSRRFTVIEVAVSASIGDEAYIGDRASIGDGASIGNRAFIANGAFIGEGASIEANDKYLCIGPIGSRRAMLTVVAKPDNTMMFYTGCFRGNLEEFEAAITSSHADNEYGNAYHAAITCCKQLLQKEK